MVQVAGPAGSGQFAAVNQQVTSAGASGQFVAVSHQAGGQFAGVSQQVMVSGGGGQFVGVSQQIAGPGTGGQFATVNQQVRMSAQQATFIPQVIQQSYTPARCHTCQVSLRYVMSWLTAAGKKPPHSLRPHSTSYCVP